MLKITGSSIESDFGVDDNEIVGSGGGAGAESGGSVVKQKVGSIVHNYPEYSENEEGVHPSLRLQRAGLIVEEAPIKVFDEYVTLLMCPFWTWLLNSPSTPRSTIMLSSWLKANRPIKQSKSPAGTPILFD